MLEFFLEGVPDVVERHLDSKKVHTMSLYIVGVHHPLCDIACICYVSVLADFYVSFILVPIGIRQAYVLANALELLLACLYESVLCLVVETLESPIISHSCRIYTILM